MTLGEAWQIGAWIRHEFDDPRRVLVVVRDDVAHEFHEGEYRRRVGRYLFSDDDEGWSVITESPFRG